MGITFAAFREIVAPYAGRAGRSSSDPAVSLFARQVMEYLLHSGSGDAIREVRLCAYRGYLSLPPEVETPLKAKINERTTQLWSHWATFHSAVSEGQCMPVGNVLAEEGNRTPLANALPRTGCVLGVLGNCAEKNAFVTIQGKDLTGKEVYTMFRGERVVGERLEIEEGQIRYGQVQFGEVTAVLKSKTNGYVTLFAINPVTQAICHFLADWAPSEERPSYRRCRLLTPCGEIVSLTLICRVRLKDNYNDQELTLFDNSLAIMLAAQHVQSEKNNDTQTANYKDGAVGRILEREGSYKKKMGEFVDVVHQLSGGSIKNIV